MGSQCQGVARSDPELRSECGSGGSHAEHTDMKAFRESLARLLIDAHLLKLGAIVLPEGSVVFLRGGSAIAFRIDGRLTVRQGKRAQ
jgi:hypothetical protein